MSFTVFTVAWKLIYKTRIVHLEEVCLTTRWQPALVDSPRCRWTSRPDVVSSTRCVVGVLAPPDIALIHLALPQMSDAEQLKYEEPTTILGKIFAFVF